MQLANNQHNELLIRLQNVRKFGDLNGTTAKKAENLHRLFLYPAMMVPITQSLIIEALSEALPKNAIAMDPYMGSGTSLMSCMEYGIGIYGQDINPLAVLIVNAKISSYNTLQIKQSYASLIDRIKQYIFVLFYLLPVKQVMFCMSFITINSKCMGKFFFESFKAFKISLFFQHLCIII